MERLDELHPAPVELDRAAEVRVADVLDALRVEPVGELDDRDARAPVRLRDRDRVGDVVGVAVGDQDVGRVHLVGGHRRGRVVRRQERVDEHRACPVGELEARVAKEVGSPSGSVLLVRFVRLTQLLGQRPADGDADHHAHPRLLGEQGADGGQPLLLVGRGAALRSSPSCASPNQPPASSASARTRCSFGARPATTALRLAKALPAR